MKLRNHQWLIIILIVGLLFRIYELEERFVYAHDQDLAGWVIRDIVHNKHLRLIGQETSVHGIFIGSLFYWMLVPFYLIFGMDPIGGLALVTLLALFGIASVYYVFSRITNKRIALIGTFIYAVSFLIVHSDREPVPTMPVIIWSLWFLYSVFLIYKGKQKQGFLLAGVLTSLIWHINMGLAVLLPVAGLAFILSGGRLKVRSLITGIASAILLSLPLIVFEIRHGFIQARAVLVQLTAENSVDRLAKLDRVVQLTNKNARSFLWGDSLDISGMSAFILLLLLFSYIYFKRSISRGWALILAVWMALVMAFFSLSSMVVAEYYLNGIIIVWVFIVAVFLGSVAQMRFGIFLVGLILAGFAIINLNRLLVFPVNRIGYIEKQEIIAEIKKDAAEHNYPCIAVSYITDPGYELGYRYFFWLNDMHVNLPAGGSPVYTIVFPHSLVTEIDKSIGALALLYPDHDSHTPDEVAVSCQGENANINEPMFGFTR